MIKFFRPIRKRLLTENKFSKYMLYAIGEIILVMIGILLALQVNNWNQNKIENKQIRNIYARIVQDFNNTAAEIDRDSHLMDSDFIYATHIIKGEVLRDSLINSPKYAAKYLQSVFGYPDIQIKDTGIRLLESKIEINYELNSELTEALIQLYSEKLFEIEVTQANLSNKYLKMVDYLIEKGIRLDYYINKNPDRFATMVFEDDLFKSYLFAYLYLLDLNSRKLKTFKSEGQELIDKIRLVHNLE